MSSKTGQYFCYVLFFGVLLFLSPSEGSNPIPISPKPFAFSGVYIEEHVTPSTFYTGLAPLVFEFQVPNWASVEEVMLPFSNCSTPDWSEGTTCHTVYYMGEYANRFAEYIFNGQPLLNRLKRMGAVPQGEEIQFKCNQLEKHFSDIYTDNVVVSKYLDKLKDECSLVGDAEFFRQIKSYNYNITSVYQNMRHGFYEEVWLKVSGGRVDAGLWSNAQNVLHSLNFFNFYMELNRWQLGVMECESGRIPSTLLTPDLFSDTLQDLFANLDYKDFLPVISSPDIGNYFKSNQLTDCTFTNSAFLVRIFVPIIPKNRSYSLYTMNPTSFMNNGESICQVKLQTASTYILMDNIEQIAFDTDCTPNKLCHAPSTTHPSKVNPCASAILTKDLEKIVKYCKVECNPVSYYHSKVATRVDQVDSYKFSISGNFDGKEEMIVKCQSSQNDWTIQQSNLIGALEVTLPSCGCNLTISNQTYKLESCNNHAPYLSKNEAPKVRQLLPFHWIKNIPKNLDKDFVIDVSWKDVQVPSSKYDDKNQESSSSGFSGINIFVLWLNFILLILLLVGLGFLLKKDGTFKQGVWLTFGADKAELMVE